MPNSRSSPFLQYIETPSDQRPYPMYKTVPKLKEILRHDAGGDADWEALVSGDRKAIFACGSGMTACIGWLANELVKQSDDGIKHVSVYDEVSFALRIWLIRRAGLVTLAGKKARLCKVDSIVPCSFRR
jgi:thiosulfate/3-mercaptopyruvate sulfurtransferase